MHLLLFIIILMLAFPMFARFIGGCRWFPLAWIVLILGEPFSQRLCTATAPNLNEASSDSRYPQQVAMRGLTLRTRSRAHLGVAQT
jgi:hypothetical protein